MKHDFTVFQHLPLSDVLFKNKRISESPKKNYPTDNLLILSDSMSANFI